MMPTMPPLDELRAFMHENIRREWAELFGLPDGPWVARAVANWFDESRNYDRRWRSISLRRPAVGRILDMAAGCGTFMLHGLLNGHDVVGVEPEGWKRTYFRRKIELANYDPRWNARMVGAVGETLPFADDSFDLVTTFQTLEHVADVDACLREMVRVLRPGGVLYLRAPNYRCFFEPHYRLPFLPTMRRSWAERYLRWLGRPVAGLRTLNWTTPRWILRSLRKLPVELNIEQNRNFFVDRKRAEIAENLPAFLRQLGMATPLNGMFQFNRRAAGWLKVGRQERVIDLWITKRAGA
jgi:ubiquinone/menaquinone biosynthesis C-methylase UbiE